MFRIIIARDKRYYVPRIIVLRLRMLPIFTVIDSSCRSAFRFLPIVTTERPENHAPDRLEKGAAPFAK